MPIKGVQQISVTGSDGTTNNGPIQLEIDWDFALNVPTAIADKTCECGSGAVGSNKHSDYCPKYAKE